MTRRLAGPGPEVEHTAHGEVGSELRLQVRHASADEEEAVLSGETDPPFEQRFVLGGTVEERLAGRILRCVGRPVGRVLHERRGYRSARVNAACGRWDAADAVPTSRRYSRRAAIRLKV